MTSTKFSRIVQLAVVGLLPATLLMSGCGLSSREVGSGATSPVQVQHSGMQGKVFGGQQPVSGATIQLYATGATGYGSASTSLLNTDVFTDSTGSFGITGSYSCPSPTSQVYITATGGNPGSGSLNTQIAVMAALGACGNLSSSTYISMNELTTVAAVWALAPFMRLYAAVGTSANNTTGIINAFATAASLVNTATGTAPGTTPTGTTVPVAELNTLANILASCINTNGGVSGDSSPCGNLFAAATPPGGSAPTDTIGAALDIATNPSHNVGTLLTFPTAQAPFQPTLTSANDLTVAIKYQPTGITSPSAAAVDASGNVWIANAKGGITEVDPNGSLLASYTSGLNNPSGLAIDTTGNTWVTNRGGNSLTVISGGTAKNPTLAGLNSPSGLAIDSQGLLWITNSGANSVIAAATSGTTITRGCYVF